MSIQDDQRVGHHDGDWLESGGSGEQASGRSVWSSLRSRSRVTTLLVVAGAIAGGAAGYFVVDPEHEATARLRVQSHVPPYLYETEMTGEVPRYEAYIDSQMAMIQSRGTLERALGADALQSIQPTLEQSVEWLRERLGVTRPGRQSELVDLWFYAEGRDLAEAALESVMEAYLLAHRDEQREHVMRVAGRLDELRGEIDERIAMLRSRQDQVAGSHGREGLVGRYQQHLETLHQAEFYRDLLQRYAEGAGGMVEQEGVGALFGQVLGDPRTEALRERKREIEGFLETQRRLGFGSNHRQIRRAEAELDDLSRELESHMGRQGETSARFGRPGVLPNPGPGGGTAGFAHHLVMSGDLSGLNAYIGNLEQEISNLSERIDRLGELQEEIERLGSRRSRIVQRVQELELEQDYGRRVEIVNPVQSGAQPHNTAEQVQYVVAGALGGGAVGLGLMLLAGLVSTRLLCARETQDVLLHQPILAVIPRLSGKPRMDERSLGVAHGVHQARALLGTSESGSSGRAYLVTSATARAGKTSLVKALGLSFAHGGSRTLMIDLDMASCALSRMADSEEGEEGEGAGVSTLSEAGDSGSEGAGSAGGQGWTGDLERCIRPVCLPGLFLLTAGELIGATGGTMSDQRMGALLSWARERFDVVLLDSGPVSGCAETLTAAAAADGTVLVVARRDQRGMLKSAGDYLSATQASMSGLVFNYASAREAAGSSYSGSRHMPDRGAARRGVRPVVDQATRRRLGPIASAVYLQIQVQEQRIQQEQHRLVA